ncbi:MAG: hypothetical protein ACYTE3_27060 [Planctomycetota bacterium]
MIQIRSIMVVSACLWLVSGCKSSPTGNFDLERRQISIITEPGGATVTQTHPLGQASTDLGTAPVKDQPVAVIARINAMENMPYRETQDLIRRVGNVIVKIEKAGYEPHLGTLKTEAGKTTVHRIRLIRL